MGIRVVTDSTCDLPEDQVQKYGITVVPLYINVADHSYRDGPDMSREEFYTRLPGFEQPPKTSAPGQAVFSEAYSRLVDDGADGIISVHISSTLSNVGNVAQLAAAEFDRVPIECFDSGNVSLATGVMARAAAQASAAGASMEEILVMLAAMRRCTYCFAALDTVEYLRRGGRMSHVMSLLATLLRVKPLLKMNDGISNAERVRTVKMAQKRLVDLVGELGPLQQLHVVHTNALERASALREMAQDLMPAEGDSFTAQVTSVLGAHLGPGAAGFVAVTPCAIQGLMERRWWLL